MSNTFQDLRDFEPVATGGSVKAAFTAVVVAFVAFVPFTLTAVQISALVGLWAVVEVFVTKWERDHVYPAARVDDKEDGSLADDDVQEGGFQDDFHREAEEA